MKAVANHPSTDEARMTSKVGRPEVPKSSFLMEKTAFWRPVPSNQARIQAKQGEPEVPKSSFLMEKIAFWRLVPSKGSD